MTIADEDLPNGQVEVEVPVAGHSKGEDDNKSDETPAPAPTTSVEGIDNPSEVQPNGKEQSTGVKVNNPEGTTVTATDEDGNKVDARIDADGNVVVTPGTNVDGPIKVTIEDEDLPNGQVEVEVPVADHAKGVDDNGSDKPVEAELPNWKADKDTGSLFPGGSVTVPNRGGKVPDGTTVEVEGPGKAEIDGKGNLVITANGDAKPGEKITVTVKDKDGNVIGTVSSIVDKKADEPSKPTNPTGTPAPQEPAIDKGKCAASAVGFGLPLLALIPIGLATQMSIPGVSEFVENVSKDLEGANAQIQQNLGMFNPQTAQALSQMNEQLRKAGFDLASVGAGIAVIAAGIIAGTIIYDNCAPGGSKSSVKVDSLQGSSGKTWNSSKKDEK